MTLETTIKPDAPDYLFRAQVIHIVDGDTFDVRLDLGFEIRTVERVRTRDIDTRETHFVPHESEEYQRGTVHTEAFERWVDDSKAAADSEWPFRFYSREYRRGAYGRVIGDLWSPSKEEWASRYLYDRFDDVTLYES